jgi:DNA-binding transcriptional regulator LsrR (DeoR family)
MNSESQLALIAKMYYIDKVKQNEIARHFSISSMMVSRMLKEAEASGIVTFHVKMPWRTDIELGSLIIKKYKLRDCYVLDIPQDDELPLRLGSYLADYFVQILPKKDAVVGLSWGNTIARFLEALPYVNVENCSLVQLTGTFYSLNSKISPMNIMNMATKKLDGHVYMLNAPLYASSRKIRDSLRDDPLNKKIAQMVAKSDINIIGLSALSLEASTFMADVIGEEDYRELSELNSIGDLAGTFMDSEGKPLRWSKSCLNTGVDLQSIGSAKHVICVAGELNKQEILRKVCDKNYFNILFTTKALAEALLG